MELVAVLLIPAIVSACCLAVSRRAAAVLTVIGAALILLSASLLVEQVVSGGARSALDGWLTCDALSALILLLVAFVGLTAALFSAGYIGHVPTVRVDAGDNYYPLYNLFLLSMLAVPILANIALVWIAIALTTLVSAFLVAHEDTPEALEAAWKYVVLTTLGAVVALLGIVFLFWGTKLGGGAPFTWSGLQSTARQIPSPVLWMGFVLVLVGFGTKAGLVPMHTWLPDAHSQAPAPICALLSGVETTTALYAVLRLFPVLQAAGDGDAKDWLVVFGLISAGAAALLLVYVGDYKRMFAFSTVEHMGIIMVAVGLGGEAHLGAAYQIAAHAITKSFCFFAAGAVVLAVGTQELASVRGLMALAPRTASAVLIGGLAIAGAPPFAVFMSELAILRGGLSSAQYAAAGLLALFVVVAFCAMMRHVNRMVFGTSNRTHVVTALPASCSAALALSALPVLVLGVYMPADLHRLLTISAAAFGGGP